MYLLDTNACIRIMKGISPRLAERLRFVPRTQIRLSSVVKAELIYGARKSGRIADNLRVLEDSSAR
jgi:tRNA(fMet)-specific endonuclease VapC